MADPNVVPRKLWEHTDPQSTQMWTFMQLMNQKYNLSLTVELPLPLRIYRTLSLISL
jgi:hypothetical protein